MSNSLKLMLLEERIVLDAAIGTVIYVNLNAHGTNNGTSWANAFTHLQDALDEAASHPGESIWVAKGTYVPTKDATDHTNTDSTQLTFTIPDQTKIYGGFKGTETSLSQRNFVTNPTILSGDFLRNDTLNRSDPNYVADKLDNSTHVVWIANGATVTMDGLSIIDGYAQGLQTNQGWGAGIYVDSTSFSSLNGPGTGTAYLTFNNDTIAHNDVDYNAYYGGYGASFVQLQGTLSMNNTVVTDSQAPVDAEFIAGSYLTGTKMDSVVITNSSFTNLQTTVQYAPLGIGLYGGFTIQVRASNFDIENNVFSNNVSGESNFSLTRTNGPNPLNKALLANNIFSNNSALFVGGALDLRNANTTAGAPALVVQDNLFTGNSAGFEGGAIFENDNGAPSTTIYDSNVFLNNTSGVGGGALAIDTSPGNILIESSLFLNNRDTGTPPSFTLLWFEATFNTADLFSPAFQEGGGAILINDSSSNVTIENSNFVNNSAPFGGAVSVSGATYLIGPYWDYTYGALPDFSQYTSYEPGLAAANILNCTFLSNKSTSGNGGAIFAGAITFPQVAFPFPPDIYPDSQGLLFPAMNDSGPTAVTITCNSFLGNTAHGDGGAISGNKTTMTATGNYFLLNNATGTGDDIYADESLVNGLSTETQASSILALLPKDNHFILLDSDDIVLA